MIAQANVENGLGLLRIQPVKARIRFIFGIVKIPRRQNGADGPNRLVRGRMQVIDMTKLLVVEGVNEDPPALEVQQPVLSHELRHGIESLERSCRSRNLGPAKRDLQRKVGHYKILVVGLDLEMWHVRPQGIVYAGPECTGCVENGSGDPEFGRDFLSPAEVEVANDAHRTWLLLLDPLLDWLC